MAEVICTPPNFVALGYTAFAMSCELELNEIDRMIS